MNLPHKVLSAMLLAGLSTFSLANVEELELALEQDLKALLTSKQKPYVPKVDPALEKQLKAQQNKKDYQVAWISRPKIEFSDADYQGYKNPVRLKLTVLANDGRIVKAEVLKSSGSKALDTKVVQALASAQLEAIAMMDRNVIYSFVHEFSIHNA
ncbi:energy transducer TonB [uncultured Acinetobacter sp.]|uniref:energy transducer TonB family protein n=1 Tax=uncultured Acinetobacter sp. TaxID=165433 RepID=UPI002605FFBC|nr:energy transducer TonB [uncultured Acinetobacter sp.]